nr:rcc01693 family protein [uncultured Gellertiella sp.]
MRAATGTGPQDDPPAPPQPFPWDAALALGFGRLRLSPAAFWAMSPRELHAAAGPPAAASTAPSRAALAGLMQAFPDF